MFQGSIFDAISRDRSPYEANLVAYLQTGHVLWDIMGVTKDFVADDGSGVPGGSSLLTDGIWVWRLDPPYFVKKYHLELDYEFIAHAARNRYVVPEVPEDRLIAMSKEAAWEIYRMGKPAPPGES